MSFCLHVSSSSSFLSLACTIVGTLVCTHTRTRTLLTARFRWPRFVTMRFGSSVVPLHLVPFHRQPHTFVCLVLLIFICPFCVHMCLPPFRAGWRLRMPPFGEACVCNPWNHRDPFGFFRFAFLFCFTAGGSGPFSSHCLTKTLLIGCDMTLGRQSHVPAISFLSDWHEAKPRTSLGRQVRPSSLCRFVVALRLWPPFPLKTSRLRWSLLVPLGNGVSHRFQFSTPYPKCVSWNVLGTIGLITHLGVAVSGWLHGASERDSNGLAADCRPAPSDQDECLNNSTIWGKKAPAS